MLGRLVAADDGRKRFLAATIMSRTGERSGPLYVHAKIGIVDDAWLAIGSANLNEHSLFNDTEVDVVTCDPAARPRHPPESCGPSTSSAPTRRRRPGAGSSTSCGARSRPSSSSAAAPGAPLTHHLVELPGVSRRSARLLGPLDALVVDG